MSGERHILLLAVLTVYNAVGIGWSLLHNQRYLQILSGMLNGTFADWKFYRLSVMEAFFHRDIVHLEAMYPNEKYWIPLESDTLASIYIHYGWIPVCILVTLLLAVVCLLIDMSREVRLNIVRYLAIGYVIRMILCLFAAVNLLVYEGMIFPFTRIESPEVIFLGIVMYEVRREREKGEKMSELKIPAFLRYPDDPISEIMFEKNMQQIQNERCRYRFSLYTEIAETVPEIEKQNPPFEINETHYYCKEGSSAWYSVNTMKDDSVLNNPVCNWVEGADGLAEMFGAMDQVLRVPKTLRGKTYKKFYMMDMEEWSDYNELHGFDESHIYGHIFYLDDQLYKKFILVAKRQDYSWRIEVNIPSEHIQMIPPDFVPAGQTFGKFYPLYD